nr:glycosyltransferase family 4 protein [Acidobacteriota bacterium]
DLFVLSSYNEGLGTVILEAMASGVPVIATDVGGVPEIIEHGENGVLFPVGDVEALAGEISRMINLDDAARGRIIRKGRETIETDYAKAVVVGKLSDLYLNTSGKQTH